MKQQIRFIPLILVIFLFVSTQNSFAQRTAVKKYMLVKSAPSYIIQISGLYDMAALELGGAYGSDFHSFPVEKGETFGTRNGLGASITSKVRLSRNSRLWFNQSISYHRIQSYLLIAKKTNSDDGNANYNAFTGGLGFEYNFTPKYSVKIFAGAEVNASMINGNLMIWTPVNGDPYNTEEYKILNSFRLGYSLGIGGTYMLSKKIGINFSTRYSCLNAFLRSSAGSDSDREFALRDASTKENLRFSGNKNFSFFSIGTGITIYFGIKNKTYKLN